MEPVRDKTYWQSKHPRRAIYYKGRPLPNGESFSMDIRHFLWQEDFDLLTDIGGNDLRSSDPDITILRIQKYVYNMLTYTSDETLGRSEYWLFPGETRTMKKGDCEDGAILMSSYALNALPDEHLWRVRLAAGYVKAGEGAELGGHAWMEYCPVELGEWYPMDWCYYPILNVAFRDRKTSNEMKHLYQQYWFSVDYQYGYSHMMGEVSGRVRPKKSEEEAK